MSKPETVKFSGSVLSLRVSLFYPSSMSHSYITRVNEIQSCVVVFCAGMSWRRSLRELLPTNNKGEPLRPTPSFQRDLVVASQVLSEVHYSLFSLLPSLLSYNRSSLFSHPFLSSILTSLSYLITAPLFSLTCSSLS